HFRQAFADDRRLGIKRIGLFVIVDGLCSVFAAAGRLILQFGNVPHGVVEIRVGTKGSWRSGAFTVGEILLLYGCSLRRRGGLRKNTAARKNCSEKECL